MKYFVEPNCQSVDPSGGEDFRRVFSAREPAFKALDHMFSSDSNEKYTLVLGDSGMGKTTLLLNYYARHSRRRKPQFALALIPLGHPESDNAIDAITERSETVLLLDAFDEDPRAIVNHRERLASIVDRTRDFRRVLITCRTQFFATAEEIPAEAGLMRFAQTAAGQSRACSHY